MLLKAKYKILRKYDTDIFNYIYYRRRKNKFFMYFRLSLIERIKKFFFQKFFYFSYSQFNRRKFKFKSVNLINPFNLNLNTLKKKNLNFKKFFKNHKRFVNKIAFKYLKKSHKKIIEILFGFRSAFRHYKPKVQSGFSRFKSYIKKITLFYNNFNRKKLLKLSKLTKKSKCGGINYFFFKLETRLDSILLRLNIGTRFFIRNLIRSKLILVDGNIVTYPNFYIKKNNMISFKKILKKKLYYILINNLKTKRFFVQIPYYIEINFRTLCLILIPKLVDPIYIRYPFIISKSKLLTGLHTALWSW